MVDADLYKKAISLVIKTNKVGYAHLQRHLYVGYPDADTIIKKMEVNGIISTPNKLGRRRVLACMVCHTTYGGMICHKNYEGIA